MPQRSSTGEAGTITAKILAIRIDVCSFRLKQDLAASVDRARGTVWPSQTGYADIRYFFIAPENGMLRAIRYGRDADNYTIVVYKGRLAKWLTRRAEVLNCVTWKAICFVLWLLRLCADRRRRPAVPRPS